MGSSERRIMVKGESPPDDPRNAPCSRGSSALPRLPVHRRSGEPLHWRRRCLGYEGDPLKLADLWPPSNASQLCLKQEGGEPTSSGPAPVAKSRALIKQLEPRASLSLHDLAGESAAQSP